MTGLTNNDLAYLNEAIRRGLIEPPWISTLHPKQKQVYSDPSDLVAALCGRQCGKSYAAAVLLFDSAFKTPNVTNLYIALTRDSAKRIIVPYLIELCDKYAPGYTYNKAELNFTLPNRSVIWIAGCDNAGEIDKFRGPQYKTVVIDEAGSFKSYLSELIEDALSAALIKHSGKVYLIGTPNVSCIGYFHDITTKKKGNYSLHHWTILDNPYLPHAKTYLEKKKLDYGWTDETPTYQREYLGRWIRSEDELIYHYNESRNTIPFLPNSSWHYVLSIDLGFSPDPSAFAVLAYSKTEGYIAVLKTFYRYKCIPDDIAKEINILSKTYSFDAIICDEGALGKTIAETIRRNFHYPIQPAEKTNKYGNIQILDGSLQTGKLVVIPKETSELVEEWNLLEWNEARTEEKGENHLADAVLYAYRHISKRHNLNNMEISKPVDPTWSQWDEDNLNHIKRQIGREKGRKWYQSK